MNAADFTFELQEAIEAYEDTPTENARVSTFEECGLLTRNEGLVVRLPDGSEFQVTVVQSKFSEEDDDE